MIFFIIVAVIAAIAMALIATVSNKGGRTKKDNDRTPIKPRAILTIKEQSFFAKLRKALPDCIVLTQVALSAILSTSGQVTRNKLSRCRADFVILDKDLKILAIIELEDPNQKGLENKNFDRNAMCLEADYRIVHYEHPPDIEQIQRDFSQLISPRQSTKPSQLALPNQHSATYEDSFFDHDF